jgi:hypothetical protein
MYTEIQRRLSLPTRTAAAVDPDRNDQFSVLHCSTLYRKCSPVELFVASVGLVNTGMTHWRDRLFLRLGPPVTSSLPFTPPLLPVPDTAPGGDCRIAIPGRAQWFINLAQAVYIMVAPDLTPTTTEHFALKIDTRSAENPDQTFDVPASLAGRAFRRLMRAARKDR